MAGKKRNHRGQQVPVRQPLTVQQLLQKVLTSESEQAKTGAVSFEEFQAFVKTARSGKILSVFTSKDRPCISFFFPESFFAGDDTDEGLLPRKIIGNLPRLCSLSEEGNNKPVLTVPEPYTEKVKDKLFWTVSECIIFRTTIKGKSFFIFLPSERIKRIEEKLNRDPAFLEAVRLRILSQDMLTSEELGTSFTEAPEGWEAPLRIEIAKPLEFLLGNCFMPRQAFVGKKNVSVLFKEIIAETSMEQFISSEQIWFRFWVEADQGIFSVYYAVDVKGQIEKYKPFFEKVFKDLVKYAALFLRREIKVDRAGGNIVGKPDPEDLKKSILFNSIINFETNQLRCRVFTPLSFFSDYCIRILPAWQREIATANEFASMHTVLAVNLALFGNNVDTFYRQSSFLSSESISSTLSVSEIIAILDDEDSRRLMQNYFLANGWSLDKIQSLFVYKYYMGEDVKPKIARDVLFDKEEYARFFPKAQRDDWEASKGVADSYEQLASLNKEALEGIFSALQSDKLILPYKAFYMLSNEFKKPLDEEYTKKIEEMIAEDKAAGFIPDIHRIQGQHALSSLPNGKLALALLMGQPPVKAIAKFISTTKRRELEEEIRIAKKRFEAGEISAETVYKEMKEFTETLEDLAIPEEEVAE